MSAHGERVALRLGDLVDQPQIFAAQGQRKTRVIVTRKNGRDVVPRHPAVASAGGDGFLHHVQWHTRFGAQHQGLADGGSTHKPQQVG